MVWARSNWKKCVFSIDCSFWICSSTGQLVKVSPEFGDALAISLARIVFALIAMFGNRLDERPFGVAILVRAVRSGELPVDVNHDSGFLRAGPAGIAGENSLAGRRDHARFRGGEETQRHLHVPVLRLQAERFARQRVEQRAAERAGGDRQKFSASSCQPPRMLQILVDHRVGGPIGQRQHRECRIARRVCGNDDAPTTHRFGMSQCCR